MKRGDMNETDTCCICFKVAPIMLTLFKILMIPMLTFQVVSIFMRVKTFSVMVKRATLR